MAGPEIKMRHAIREGRGSRLGGAFGRLGAVAAALLLASCGGSEGDARNTSAAERRSATGANFAGAEERVAGTTQLDAVRLAHQATFGPNEELVGEIRAQGAKAWVVGQLSLGGSHYRLGGDDSPDTITVPEDFCSLPPQKGNPYCWRDYISSEPLVWDFYRNAVRNKDQLRQRMALALSQLLVVSNREVDGTYGLRDYQNTLLDGALGNYRDLLRKVVRSPVMGRYLNHVNNDAAAPNENFARELLQLFTMGPCRLDSDGTLSGGRCRPTYDNDTVRNYAYAMTGWTYPAGGGNRWGVCRPVGANCRYLHGDMVPASGTLRDTEARKLLSGVVVPANTKAGPALDLVLDSLMAHANLGPFIARHLIQHLVTSNPSKKYVGRVAQAFDSGRFEDIGSGVKGDLAATVAAVLLDSEARNETPDLKFGRLREPAQLFTGVIRAIGGNTDGAIFGFRLGENLSQHLFRSPTVFNFYPTDFPLSGTSLNGPAFGINNASTTLARMTYLTLVFDKGGTEPDDSIPGAVGTHLNFRAWLSDARDPAALVDRMSLLALGQPMAEPARGKVIEAVAHFTEEHYPDNWREKRVARAGWLVLASPQYQVIR